MKLTAVFLIILTTLDECTLNNLDRANPTFIKMENLEACNKAAETIDLEVEQRAFCFDPQETPQ